MHDCGGVGGGHGEEYFKKTERMEKEGRRVRGFLLCCGEREMGILEVEKKLICFFEISFVLVTRKSFH